MIDTDQLLYYYKLKTFRIILWDAPPISNTCDCTTVRSKTTTFQTFSSYTRPIYQLVIKQKQYSIIYLQRLGLFRQPAKVHLVFSGFSSHFVLVWLQSQQKKAKKILHSILRFFIFRGYVYRLTGRNFNALHFKSSTKHFQKYHNFCQNPITLSILREGNVQNTFNVKQFLLKY